MEKYTLNKDIDLICVRAASFPDGIAAAFQKLEKTDPSIPTRNFFGISRGSDTGTLYWAAAEAGFKEEAEKLGLESYTVRKGIYVTETLKNFKEDLSIIGRTFDKLLEHPKLDETGECVEWYKSEDEVQCLVRIIE